MRAKDTIGLDLGPPPKGWDRDVWTLYRTLDTCVKRLPHSTAPARILAGPRFWLAFAGHRTKGPWWPVFLQHLGTTVQLADDEPSTRLLAPWLQAIPAGPAASGFRPYEGGEP